MFVQKFDFLERFGTESAIEWADCGVHEFDVTSDSPPVMLAKIHGTKAALFRIVAVRCHSVLVQLKVFVKGRSLALVALSVVLGQADLGNALGKAFRIEESHVATELELGSEAGPAVLAHKVLVHLWNWRRLCLF